MNHTYSHVGCFYPPTAPTALNRSEMKGVIEKLQEAVARTKEEADKLEKEGAAAAVGFV